MRAIVGAAFAAVLTAALLVSNFWLFPRDATLTTDIASFKPDEIVRNRLWVEGPVQVLNTFMGEGTFIVAVGVPGEGGLPFANRLKLSFGDDNIDQSSSPIDLREFLMQDELDQLGDFIQELSYRSSMTCPHDLEKTCTIAVGWNRQRTKEVGIRLFATRVSEDTYLIVDDSILEAG